MDRILTTLNEMLDTVLFSMGEEKSEVEGGEEELSIGH
jgi:hypothetical protein